VRKHPQTHGNSTRDGRVGRPEGPGQRIGRIQDGEQRHTDGRAGRRAQYRHAQVAQGAGRVDLKAVGWNDGANLVRLGKVGVVVRERLALEAREHDAREIHHGACFDGFFFIIVVVVGQKVNKGCRRYLLVDGNGAKTMMMIASC